MAKRNLIIIGLFLIIITLTTVSVSAGFFEWFEKTITGRLGTQATNVTITLTGISPAVIYWVTNYSISPTNANESGARNLTFSVRVSDTDGVGDINDTSVYVNFTKTGQTKRVGGSYCALVGDLSTTQANYSCSVEMWYWDSAGNWTINVRASDLGNGTLVFNITEVFQYNELKALTLSPYGLTWPGLSIGAKNQTSDNDPQYVNNTGNYNGTIDLTGKNLLGETDSAWVFEAGNFSMDTQEGGSPPAECNRTNVLTNGTSITVAYSYSNPGNLSKNDGSTGQEAFYYCISLVPNVMSQVYSTKEGSWYIIY